MENEINLIMNDDKSIDIFHNNDQKRRIIETQREITAKEIYDIFNYKTGDSYKVNIENKKEIDKPVLSYFKEVFEKISERIDELNKSEIKEET